MRVHMQGSRGVLLLRWRRWQAPHRHCAMQHEAWMWELRLVLRWHEMHTRVRHCGHRLCCVLHVRRLGELLRHVRVHHRVAMRYGAARVHTWRRSMLLHLRLRLQMGRRRRRGMHAWAVAWGRGWLRGAEQQFHHAACA